MLTGNHSAGPNHRIDYARGADDTATSGKGASIEGDGSYPRFAGGYRGWAVLTFCIVMLCVSSGPVYYSFGLFAMPFAQTFGAPRTLISLALTLTMLVSSLGSGPLGWLADRYTLRPLLMCGVVGTAAGLALVSLTTAMWQVVLLYGTLIAAADTLLGVMFANLLLSRWFDRRRGLVIGLAALGASSGAIIYPPLTGFLIEEFGWRASYVGLAISVLALGLPVWFFATAPANGMPAIERMPPEQLVDARSGPKAILAVREFWILAAAVGLLAAVNAGVIISLVPFAISRGTATVDAATLMSIFGGGAVTGKLLASVIADRVDLRWALRGAVLLCALALALLGLVPGGFGLWAACAALIGLSMGGQLPLWGAITARLFDQRIYGRALGLSKMAMTPLTFTLPLLAGWIFDRTGDYEWIWRTYALFGAVVLIATLTMRPIRRGASSAQQEHPILDSEDQRFADRTTDARKDEP